MRIISLPSPIMLGILVHLLLVVALTSVAADYQLSGSSNWQPEQQSRLRHIPNSCQEDRKSTPNSCQGDRSMDRGMDHRQHGQANDPKQTAVNIALQAAQAAKKASDNQLPLAVAAARQVKQQLAEKASAAAWAAEAAMIGKKQVVEQLQDEVREAEIVLQEENNSVAGSHANLDCATSTVNQARILLKQMQNAIKVTKDTVSSAEVTGTNAQRDLMEKTKLVEAARARVEMLIKQLHASKLEYENTKKAAYKAACAASEAREKARRERRSWEEEMNGMNAVGSGRQQEQYQPQMQPQFQEVNQWQPHQWQYNQQGEVIFPN